MERTLPRVLLAAPKSGAGKTTVVCGLLQALVNRGMHPAACKCGPDYIDPLFHSEVIGAKGCNLDLFFTEEDTARHLMAQSADGCEIAVLEGVMGYYDGLGGVTDRASAYHVATATETPVILVLDARGTSLSLCAQLKGFLEFRKPSSIQAVLLNRCSAMQFPMLQKAIAAECGVPVLGYLPALPQCALESRHLGLVTAQEVADLQEKLRILAETLTETVDLEALLHLARSAPPLHWEEAEIAPERTDGPVLAVAKDKAFCFYYRENFRLLQALGAKIVEFSPLTDKELPPCDGLYLGGGYPELYTKQLSENRTMRESIAQAIRAGLPTFAECGGFLYLHQEMTGEDGTFPMVGVIPGGCRNTGKLRRFGYVTLTAKHDNLLCGAGESIRAHEFHYFESDSNGAEFHAEKPVTGRGWECIHATNTLFAGFPHLYFPANPEFARRFVRRMRGVQSHDFERSPCSHPAH